MSSYRAGDIESALQKKGFQKHNNDHRRYTFIFDGRKTSVHTKISHGIREYGDSLLKKVAQQLHLDKRQIEDFIECPMTAEQYVDHLLTNQHVRVPSITESN